MTKFKKAYLKYPIIFFVILFFYAGRPVEFGQERAFFHSYAIAKPIIRIALGRQLSEVNIKASAGMKIYEVGSQYRLLAADASELLARGKKIQLSEKFSVQVAQADSRQEAEKIARSVRLKINTIAEDVDRFRSRRFYSVRFGDFLTRGEALSFIRSLSEAGIEEAWVVREEVARPEKNAFWALVDNELIHFPEQTTLYLVPANAWSFLSFNDTPYRGFFLLRASGEGLQVINILNLEDYLKGVVPMELSPARYPELEALKAQAIAARTYAWRNLGLMEAEGFDLTATPEHQAYGGMRAENPLSNQAVEETKGQGLFYRGKPINALYTSTCGGMTEEGKAVFGGADVPYLRAVECVEEKFAEERITTSRPPRHFHLGPRDITREVSLLVALGILSSDAEASFLNHYFNEPALASEVVSWVKTAGEYLHLKTRSQSAAPPADPLTPSIFSRFLIDYLGWLERAENLLLQSEVDFLLRDFPQGADKERRPVAYLIREGYLTPTSDLTTPGKAISRGEVLCTLAKVIQKEKYPLRLARFRGLQGREVKLEEEGKIATYSLSPRAFLFRSLEGEVFPAQSLIFLGGEEVLFLEKEGQVFWLELRPQPATNVLDRSSAHAAWQVRFGREELSRRLNEYFPIGELKDLQVKRRGKSHRVLELEIIGEAGKAAVKGLRVRWVLGLRDTLFTIDREFDDQGRVSHFIFTGRGWGHGVGLCQVGAFGLAQRGTTYRDILNKYYPGTKIGKLY